MTTVTKRKPQAHGRTECGSILVGAGDASHRRWLANNLTEVGYTPTFAENYSELVRELETHEDLPVILDPAFDVASQLATYGNLLLDGLSPRMFFLLDGSSGSQLEARASRMGVQGFLGCSNELKDLRKTLSSVRNASPCRNGMPLLGISAAIKELRSMIRSVALTDAPVMICGESGTGKELVARATHDCGARANEEFVPVNVAALPDSLIESVLFGHEKGAFTGAEQRRNGLCEHAHRGTLFLDEIGEMHRELQPKLLRFLQEGTVQKVGSTQIDDVDVRIISATNRNVEDLTGKGVLREDLFFRLHVIPITLPSLRERVEDIPILAEAFLKRKCCQMRRNLSFSQEVIDRLCDYSWPGNIRQLENLVERLAVMTPSGVIGLKSLPPEWFTARNPAPVPLSIEPMEELRLNDRQLTRMQAAERRIIIDALQRHQGNVVAAAGFLGLGQATLYRKIRTFEIPKSFLLGCKE